MKTLRFALILGLAAVLVRLGKDAHAYRVICKAVAA